MEDNSMWRCVINLKYGTEAGGWFPSLPTSSRGVGLWKEISKEVAQIKHHCSIELGDGCKTKFSEDLWCGEATLCSTFPSLYDVADSKGARVVDLLEAIGPRGG